MTTDPNLRLQINHDTKQIDVRQSAIQAYLNCPRKFYWEYVVGLEPDYPNSVRPFTTADLGTAVHEALGAYYGDNNDPLLAWRAWAMDTFETMTPEGCDPGLIDIMVEGHIDDLAADGADLGETTISIEEPIIGKVKDVAGWDVNIHGRVDRRIETEDGLNIIDDWKTVGPLGSTLGHIQQLGRYAVMIRQEMGWRADRVRTTQIRKVKRTKAGPFYSRPWVPLNEDAYQSHARQLRWALHSMITQLTVIEDADSWIFNVTTECDWKCRVQDLCLAQQYGDDTEVLVDLHYRLKGQEGNQ